MKTSNVNKAAPSVDVPRLVRLSSFSWKALKHTVFNALAKSEGIRPLMVNETQEVEVWLFMEKGDQQVGFQVFRLNAEEYPELKTADHLWIGLGLREGMDTMPNRSAYFHLGPDIHHGQDRCKTYCLPSKTSRCGSSECRYAFETNQPRVKRDRNMLSSIWDGFRSCLFLSND